MCRLSRAFGPIAVMLLIAAPNGAALAKDILLGGLRFSDRGASIELHDGWGSGTREDPFVLVEDLLSDDNAVLTITGVRRDFGNRIDLAQPIGFTLTKIVRNLTPRPWHIFEMEVRELRERASTYEDGLSFAQASGDKRLYKSDRFTDIWQTDEPLDAVTFSGDTIHPGETVQMTVTITDFSPSYRFFLIQRRQSPLADRRRSLARDDPTTIAR